MKLIMKDHADKSWLRTPTPPEPRNWLTILSWCAWFIIAIAWCIIVYYSFWESVQADTMVSPDLHAYIEMTHAVVDEYGVE